MENQKENLLPETTKKVMVPINDLFVKDLLSQAIQNKVPVETMERLLAMRRELKAEYAKTEFDKAMAAFQAECPTIRKTKEVKTNTGTVAYRYAPIEDIVAQVKGLLEKNGFSYSTQQILNGKVKIICQVKHIAGHSENYEMEVPLGNKTQIMSDSQVVAAASTFAKRYAFCNAFGILTGDEDVDGMEVKTKQPTTNISAYNNLKIQITKELKRLGLETKDYDKIKQDIKFWTNFELEEVNFLKIYNTLKAIKKV